MFNENYDINTDYFEEEAEMNLNFPDDLDENEEIENVEEIKLNEPPARIEIVDTMPENVKTALQTFNEILDYSREEDKKNYELMRSINSVENEEFDDNYDFDDSYDDDNDEDYNIIDDSTKEFDEEELNDFF